jgi:hypothetical protein
MRFQNSTTDRRMKNISPLVIVIGPTGKAVKSLSNRYPITVK